jgi:hypothetical protein
MANIKDFIKKIGNSAVSLEEQQQALAQVEQTIIEAKQKRTEAVGKNADMVIQALKTIEAKLEAKLAELNNTPAKQGVQGPAGQDGTDGKDGKAGRDGISGKDGTDGKDGVDGKDGISVVDAKIDFDGSLVVYLSNGSEIDCGQILQPEVAKNIIISSGGSGTSQVVTDTLVSLQNQINTLTGIDGVLGDMAQQNANAVAITGGTATLTSVTTPVVQATNSAGLALRNSGGTTQISMGAGGGDNVTVAVSTNLNGTNAQIDISPTGTGHVHIKPTGANSVEIAPTFVGEMDNITIGATTPSSVNATTITGQTGVLRGTGTNLVVQSQAFATTWLGSGLTRTNNASTAPDSTNTASSLIETATTAVHWVFTSSGLNLFAGTYTLSCYVKANGRTAATLAISGNTSNQYAAVTFDLSGVAVTQTNVAGTGFSVTSSSITSVGSGWYRCVMTAAIPFRSDYLFMLSTSDATTFSPNSIGGANSYAGNAALGILAWGAQLEAYSTVGTYVPTTTTSLLGNPTLSFANLAYIGMENTGSVYVQPALTGALQAQTTTSTTAGGNARGTYAVDWQTIRSAASQVASGTYATLGGGINNTVGGFGAIIAGGGVNTASATYAAIGGGQSNNAGSYSYIGSGQSNTGSGLYNFIGGGFTNSGTSGSAVTTQSGTMNATTAVTLSGSNANIKVGQYISGTSIAADTYVAAISGTALTLSKVASGSSTSTLSFFTPHGVVVGGGNNQATGSYSFIGGGGDAGTAANRNVASGDWSVVAGGQKNLASGQSAFVGAGGNIGGSVFGNTASGLCSAVVSGFNNTAGGYGSFVGGGASNNCSATYAGIAFGNSNSSNSDYSSILGGTQGTTRSIIGFNAQPNCNNPLSSPQGASQGGMLVLGVQTTDATATALRSNSSAASGTNQVILPNNSAYFFRGEIISGVTGGGDTKGWTIEGVIKRGANAAATTLVGVTVLSTHGDAGAATWTIGVTADTTNGGIRVTFTGQASTTIRTVCQIRTTEMTY